MSTDVGAAFREVMRAELAPALRALAFRGGPATYARDAGDVWVLVNLQSARAFPFGMGEPGVLSFTANLGVASKRILEAQGTRPTKRPERRDWHYDNRIGMFLAPPFDKWWAIEPAMSRPQVQAVVLDFRKCLVDQGLNGIARYSSDDLLRQYWAAELEHLSPRERAWFSVLLGARGQRDSG